MMKQLNVAAALAALAFSAAPALAQDSAVTVKVSESDEYGKYLTDADGRALYLFTADTQGKEGSDAQVSCSGECLDKWPPLYTEGEPQAGDMIDSSMLGTVEHDAKMVVTYNGWPLYYFFKDEGAGAPAGQDVEAFGGEWYLVTPEGEKVDEE